MRVIERMKVLKNGTKGAGQILVLLIVFIVASRSMQ